VPAWNCVVWSVLGETCANKGRNCMFNSMHMNVRGRAETGGGGTTHYDGQGRIPTYKSTKWLTHRVCIDGVEVGVTGGGSHAWKAGRLKNEGGVVARVTTSVMRVLLAKPTDRPRAMTKRPAAVKTHQPEWRARKSDKQRLLMEQRRKI